MDETKAENRKLLLQKAIRQAIVSEKKAILFRALLYGPSIPPSAEELDSAFADILEKLM
jgi:hypothetical protein